MTKSKILTCAVTFILALFTSCSAASGADTHLWQNGRNELILTTEVEVDISTPIIEPPLVSLDQSSTVQLQESDTQATESVVIPIHGVKVNNTEFAYNQVSTPSTVEINEDTVLSMTELSDELDICWYLDNDIQKCAYRRYGGEWFQFLAEDSAYRDGFGAQSYENLFGHSGFFIEAPRGAAYFAYDYYYFEEDGTLRFLFAGTFLDTFVDFNNDGNNELLWFYHGDRDAIYYYTSGSDIFMFEIIGALSACFNDWEYIAVNPLSLHNNTLQITYRCDDEQYAAQISFVADTMIVQSE